MTYNIHSFSRKDTKENHVTENIVVKAMPIHVYYHDVPYYF